MPKHTPTQRTADYSPPYTGKQELHPAELEIYKNAEAAAQEATKEARAKHEMHKKEDEAFRKAIDAIKALLAKSKGGSRRRRAQKSSRKSSKRAFRKKSRRMH